jgi:hypothetical protein
MKYLIWSIFICLFFFIGCSKFYIAEPLYPKLNNREALEALSGSQFVRCGRRGNMVETVQPVFEWKPLLDTDATYDLIVLEVICLERKTLFDTFCDRAPGKIAYYREGLKEPRHKINIPLKPNTEYYWAVRVRNGDETSQWSWYGDDFMETKTFYFFRTPSASIIDTP